MAAGERSNGSIRPGGRDVELFNEQVFAELRAYAQVPDDFCNEGWDLDQLKAGGGKGGTLMAHIGSSYIVKELSAGDHGSLLAIAGSYAMHVRTGETLLCPIYLHFRDLATKRCFFAMRNCVGQGPFLAVYDLKGCADDKTLEVDGLHVKAVHKRIWNVRMWLGKTNWTDERHRYFEGKQAAKMVDLFMTREQRNKFLACTKRDTEWLAGQGLMDYSLLVAVTESPAGQTATGGCGPSALALRPMTRRGRSGFEIGLQASIIDFLQKWTNGKRVARCIKFMEANKATVPPRLYAARFLRHFEERCQEAPGDEARGPPPKAAVPPARGDVECEGGPEERLNSRGVESQESSKPLVSAQPSSWEL